MGKLSDEEKLAVKAGMVVAGILSTFALRYVEPTRGVGKLAMVSHALFAVFAVALCFAPEKLSDLLFMLGSSPRRRPRASRKSRRPPWWRRSTKA